MNEFSHIDDPAVGALPVLLGPEAAEVLGAALSPAGGRVRSLHITQIRYTPGRAIVVRYRVDVGWDDGRSTREVVVAASGERIPDGPIVLSSGDTEISIWSYPHDPALPGLAVITDEQRAKRVFNQLGIASAGAPRLRLRSYRPLRRAVLEAATPRGKVFFKLVRPSAVADLQAKHQALSAVVPVPQSMGWNADLGLVALQAMPGKPLRKALEAGTRRLPAAGDYPSLLDRLPDLGEIGG
ncbi:MAG: aminoglycoside phosphotransferase, partial [Acidimicrobiia bacterium]|nr:aminoglycoside phosphotransferase [Acidimicrobiia bacterium]